MRSDRVSGHPPLHFDLSFLDIFGAFAAGAELHLVPRRAQRAAEQASRFHSRSGLTQWFSVPSVLNYMARLDAVRPNDFPALKRVLWCGEVLPTPSLIYWMQRLPHVEFTNLYGPTETTIASSYYTVPAMPGTRRRRFRSAPRAPAKSCSCSTTVCARFPPERSATSTSAASD